ncbi:hypothetical protein ACFLWY_00235 [Chloroflexota bacterium]
MLNEGFIVALKKKKFDITEGLPYEKEVLHFLNRAKTPKDITDNIVNDPEYQGKGVGIGIKVAARLLEIRDQQFGGKLRSLHNLYLVPYFGHDKFHDLVYSAKRGVELPRQFCSVTVTPLTRREEREVPSGRTVISLGRTRKRGRVDGLDDDIDEYEDMPDDAPPGLTTSLQGPSTVTTPGSSGDCVVYIASDQHMGSHSNYIIRELEPSPHGGSRIRSREERIDKSQSNLFDARQARRFVNWISYVDRDHRRNHPNAQCHLVINGDFLDLWQALARRSREPMRNINRYYGSRIDEIIGPHIYEFSIDIDFNEDGSQRGINSYSRRLGHNPNYDVVAALLGFAALPNRKVIYLIGNHDDPLFTGTIEDDDGYRARQGYRPGARYRRGVEYPHAQALRELLDSRLERIQQGEGIPHVALSNFIMGRFYWNRELGIYAEHGHVFDSSNWKDEDPCDGQELIEQHLNEIRESGHRSFRGIGNVPYSDMIKYLECELARARSNPSANRRSRDLIARFIEKGAETAGFWYGLLEEFSPLEYALKIFRNAVNEESRKYYDKSRDLQRSIGAPVLVLGHTHIPFCLGRGNSVFINTGEWIYDIRFSRTANLCSLRKVYGATDYYMKANRISRNYLEVALRRYTGHTTFCRYQVRIP